MAGVPELAIILALVVLILSLVGCSSILVGGDQTPRRLFPTPMVVPLPVVAPILCSYSEHQQ